MKKIMSASLILLPLIILIILTASTAIVSATNHIYVESVEIADSDTTLTLYKTSDDARPSYQLTTNVFPLFATNKEIVYRSDDESVVEVDSSGVVYGIGFGETYVYAISKENSIKSAMRRVVVTDRSVHSVEILNPVSLMYLNEEYQLEWRVTPEGAENKAVAFVSSDPSVAEVTFDGAIFARTSGVTEITVYAVDNPAAKATMTLRVTALIESAALDGDINTVVLAGGQAHFPDIVCYPSTADYIVEYVSSDNAIATVDDNGNISFLKAGSVTVTAKIIGTDYVFSKVYTSTRGYLTGVTVSGAFNVRYEDYAGRKPLDISVSVSPSDADMRYVTYDISDTDVIERGEDGEFYVVGGGRTDLTVYYKTSDTAVGRTTVTINVTRDLEGVDFRDPEGVCGNFIYAFDEMIKIDAVKIPSDATDEIVYVSQTEGVSVYDGYVLFDRKDVYKEAVIAYSAGGGRVSGKFRVAYIDDSELFPIEIPSSGTAVELYMPAAIDEQKLGYAFYVRGADSVVVTDANGIVRPYDTVYSTGVFSYEAVVDGAEPVSLTVNVLRKVERIDGVTFTAVLSDEEYPLASTAGRYYTVADKVRFGYALYPADATLTEARVTIAEGDAYVEAGYIVFRSAGVAEILIEADGVESRHLLESTFGHPDGDTVTVSEITAYAGETVALRDMISAISPYGADISYITIAGVAGAAIAEGEAVSALYGGTATVEIKIETCSGSITRYVTVNVGEAPSGITLKDNYILTDKPSLVIDEDLFKILPLTANIDTEYTVQVTEGNAKVAENVVNFTSAGLCRIRVTLANGVSAELSAVYSGDLEVISFTEGEITEISLGKEFVAELPHELVLAFDGFSELNGINCIGGVFTVSEAVDEGEEYSASFAACGKTFRIKGVKEAVSISAFLTDETAFDKEGDVYVTASGSATFVAALDAGSTYKETEARSLTPDIASVTANGDGSYIVTFLKAGEAVIEARSVRSPEVKTALVLRSSFGAAEKVEISVTDLVLDFGSDTQAVCDLSAFVTLYPSNAVIGEVARAVAYDAAVVSADGLVLEAEGGGETTVLLSFATVGGYEYRSVNVSVKRSGEDIEVYLNGSLSEAGEYRLGNGLVNISVKATPADATYNNTVSAAITAGAEYAELIGSDVLRLKEAGQTVEVTFCLDGTEVKKVYSFIADSVVFNAVADVQGNYVVPKELPFVFKYKGEGYYTFPAGIKVVSDDNNGTVCEAASGGVYTMTAGGVSRTLVVTEKAVAIGDVTVKDYCNATGATAEITLGSDAFYTASSSVTLMLPVSGAVNADGSAPEITASASGADYSDGELTFTAAGTAYVTVTLEGEDAFGAYKTEKVFRISSTFGAATSFELSGYPASVLFDETREFALPQVTVTAPAYGGDEAAENVSFVADGRVFAIDGDTVTVVASGTGSIEAVARDCAGAEIFRRRIEIFVSKYIDEIRFENAKGYDILCDYVNTDVYTVRALFDAAEAAPTDTALTYEFVPTRRSLSASTIDALTGEITFAEEYGVYTVRVYANGGAEAYVTVVKVASCVTIIEALNGDEIYNIDSNAPYVINSVGAAYHNIAFGDEVTVVNAACNVFSVAEGKLFSISPVPGTEIEINVCEDAERIDFAGDMDIAGENLTARTEIDLDAGLIPSVYPATARDDNGAIVVTYSIASGAEYASVSDGKLVFTAQGTAEVNVTAGSVNVKITVTSSFGYVSEARWEVDDYAVYLETGSISIAGDYTVYPLDVDSARYNISVENVSIATINADNTLTAVKGGRTDAILAYEVDQGVWHSVSIPLEIYDPVSVAEIMYGGNATDTIITGELNYLLETRFDKEDNGLFVKEFVSGDTSVAEVGADGTVAFFRKNTFVTLTLRAVNPDGSVAEASVRAMYTDRNILVAGEGALSAEYDQGESVAVFVPGLYGGHSSALSAEGKGVITVVDGIFFTLSAGGSEALTVTSGALKCEVEVYSYRKTQSVSVNDSIKNDYLYTSFAVVDLMPALYPADSAERKDVIYTLKGAEGFATVSGDGVLTFTGAAEAEITVSVVYKGVTEAERTVRVRSSFGKVESFDISAGGDSAVSSYVFEDKNESRSFVLINVAPADATEYSFAVDCSALGGAVSCSETDGGFTLTSSGRGAGNVTVSVDGVLRMIAVTAKIKVDSVTVAYGATRITDSARTMAGELVLTVGVYPLDANDRTLVVTVNNGGTAVLTGDSLTLTMPAYKDYTLTISSADGGYSGQLTVTRINTLTSFNVTYNGQTHAAGAGGEFRIELPYNASNAVLQLGGFPTDLIGPLDYGAVSTVASDGITLQTNSTQINVVIPAFTEASPAFNGSLTVKSGSLGVNVTINRDGIKSIEFTDHDNTNDSSYGLQQIRLFGKQSYYDGGNKTYYKMPVSVLPAAANKALTWTTDNQTVKCEYKASANEVLLYFNNVTGNTETDIRNDIFDKTVTVTATDASGSVRDSYTFHIVNNGVNVFDQAGFLANKSVVLHVNLGGTEESALAKYAPYSYTANPGKTLIYGNGFVINFYAWNNQYTSSMGNNLNTSVGKAYNVNLKGGNFDASKGSYHNNFGGSYFYYCKIQQTYKGIWAGDGNQIRNCYFRYITDMSIQISNADKTVYVENIISIDGGNAALECQNKSYYLKGFIDVYNFKSKKDLKDMTVTETVAKWMLNDLKSKGNFVREINGDPYFNVVLYSGKTGGASRPVYFWNGSSYVSSNKGSEYAANGLTKLTSSFLLAGSVAVYSYELDVIDYYDQYNADGSENIANLSQQERKLLRENKPQY